MTPIRIANRLIIALIVSTGLLLLLLAAWAAEVIDDCSQLMHPRRPVPALDSAARNPNGEPSERLRTVVPVLAAGGLSIGPRTSAPLHAPRITSKDRSFSRHHRAGFAALLGMSVVVASNTYAAQFDLRALQPSSLFVQAGVGDQDTHAYVAGATWTWNWRRHISFLTASGYFEAGIGRWTTDEHGVNRSAWATQIGMTPVIRLQPSGRTDRWFAEIGVGANYIVPLYQTNYKRFSTEFNFGDHFGIGRQFGQYRQHELMLRMQHFSNAGIAHPNPGENFLQLRYSRKL